jgi:arylsulfatase A-like enzyme
MKKHHAYFLSIAMTLLLAYGCTSTQSAENAASTTSRPNILFIAVDDLRPELNVYGASHIQSPNMDILASQSLLFDRAYCNVPVCGASRASLMSGVRPGRYRFVDYDTRLDEDYPGVLSLPKHFKNNGYTTISNGKIYHHGNDDKDAWDEIWHPKAEGSPRDYLLAENIAIEEKGETRGAPFENADVPDSAYRDGRTALKAIADLKKLKHKGEPFFLAVGFLKPHLPFNAPSKYWDMYDRSDISLPENYRQPETIPSDAFHNFGEMRHYAEVPKEGPVTEEMARELIHGYYACVSYTDAQIGLVLESLKELGLDDNTIVVLWGDHGWNLGDHQLWCKHCNFESSLHVPLMVKMPGLTGGERTDALAEYIDIYPSLCELSNLPIPEHVDGSSFVPLMKGNDRKKDFVVSKYFNGVTIITGDYFYTEWLNADDQVKARMLFDHSTDPLEEDNLAEKPEYKDKVQELSTMLHENWGDDFFVDRRVADAANN